MGATTKAMGALAIAMTALASARGAAADTGPSQGMISLMQSGQDVVIGLEFEGRGGCDIVRVNQETGQEVAVCEERDFTEDEFLHETSLICYSGGVHVNCGDTPEWCSDCNGDGVPECGSYCYRLNVFSVVDSCVSPGTWEYSTPYASLSGTSWMVLDVSDSGDPCLGAEPGATGCSAAGGSSTGAPLLALLAMVCVGGAALRKRRGSR